MYPVDDHIPGWMQGAHIGHLVTIHDMNFKQWLTQAWAKPPQVLSTKPLISCKHSSVHM